MTPLPDLPVTGFLPEICGAVKNAAQLVVVAAPGAGKTTMIPPALLDVVEGKILLLEPRRIAARSAAERIAALRKEKTGGAVGFAVRGESRQSAGTRLLAVTPGVMLEMLQEDPALENVGAIVFDEFHERQMQVDLALALALASREMFSSGLKIIVMSATLDAEKVAPFLGARIFNVPGRTFPVGIVRETIDGNLAALPRETARAVLRALPDDDKDVLVFLPGAAEINRTKELLTPVLKGGTDILTLYGAMDFSAQKKIFSPSSRRRIILSTNLAESSVTVPGIGTVIDTGWEKRLRFDPGAGLSFLETRRISRHGAEQRAGRAGRLGPGRAIRLYGAFDEAAFRTDATPEILECDLAFLALSIARWGASCDELFWLDAPPQKTFAAAQKLLENLGALDGRGTITPFGAEMAKLPVHPRLAAMILRSKKRRLGATGCRIAALLEEREAEKTFSSADLRLRLEAFEKSPEKFPRVLELYRKLLSSCDVKSNDSDAEKCGELVACAFPEWIGRRRNAGGTEYLLADSGGAHLFDAGDPVSSEFLAVARLGGRGGGKSVIQLAAPISRDSVEKIFPDRILTRHVVEISSDFRAAAFVEKTFGAIVLNRRPEAAPPEALTRAVLAEALRRGIALPPQTDSKARRLLERIRFAREREKDSYPDWNAETWKKLLSDDGTVALFGNVRSLAELENLPWYTLLRKLLGETTFRMLERFYPGDFRTPAGALHAIDYSGEQPTLAVKFQELYGQNTHPCVGKAALPLRLELLSPAGRTVQITCDLPGFWRGNWEAVRREMKSRYPKHLWPENPLETAPTFRTVKPKTHEPVSHRKDV